MKVRVPPLSLLFWIALLILDHSGSAIASLLAAFLHEAGHLLAMRHVGMQWDLIVVYPFGLSIRTLPHLTSYRQDFLIASAGILVNLLSALCALALLPIGDTAGMLSFLAASLALALINALPHPLLDGGGMLRALLLTRLEPDLTERILRVTSEIVLLPILTLVLYLFFYGRGSVTMYLLAAYLLLTLAWQSKNRTG